MKTIEDCIEELKQERKIFAAKRDDSQLQVDRYNSIIQGIDISLRKLAQYPQQLADEGELQ